LYSSRVFLCANVASLVCCRVQGHLLCCCGRKMTKREINGVDEPEDEGDDVAVRSLAANHGPVTHRSAVSFQHSHSPSGHGGAVPRSISVQLSSSNALTLPLSSSKQSLGPVKQFRHDDDSTSFVVRENGPVKDVSNSGDARFMNTWLAEVTIAHPNGSLIRKYNEQHARMEQVRFAVRCSLFAVPCSLFATCRS
jgi:hypothetical protein